jgi:HAD superfamily hydrolase (TIGR01662 family)
MWKWAVIIVSGIEKGLFTTAEINNYIKQVFLAVGKQVTDYWACPRINSPYRKPSPNMVLALADKHHVNLTKSTYVGDSESDYQCAQSAGVSKFCWASDYFGWS